MADLQLQSVLTQLRRAPADEGAWEQLFRLTWPFVLALCHRSLIGPRRLLDADDLAQEVYFKFARYWHQRRPAVRDERSLLALLAVITRSLARDAGRSQSRKRRDAGRESPLAAEPTERHDDYAEVDLRDFLDRVSLQMDQEEQSIVSLRLEGYEVEQIAEQLGASSRTIERKLQRIRQTMKPFLLLEPDAPEKENDTGGAKAQSLYG